MVRLIFSNVSQMLGSTLALDRVSIDVSAKRIAVLGTNGSGKTTFLALVTGLLKPTRGNVFVNGLKPYRDREKLLKETSFMYEKAKLPYRIRFSNFVNFVSSSYSHSEEEMKLFEWGSLSASSRGFVNELSSGEEQLAILYSILSREMPLVILDEPFSHLDPLKSGRITDRLLSLNKEIIFTTHIPEEAEVIGDHILVLDRGHVVWSGRRDALYRENTFEVMTTGKVPEDLDVTCSFGNVLIVKSDIARLVELLKIGRIVGFRRAGVRRIYGEVEVEH